MNPPATIRRELRLEHGLAAVPQARRRLQRDLAALPLPRAVVQDASMVVGELVANAVRHGVPDEDGGVRVAWFVQADRLRVSVRDAGGLGRPRVRHPGPSSGSGRGLLLVEALSAGWWADNDDGMRVTAELELPSLS